MNKNPQIKIVPLIIGGSILMIGLIIGFVTPDSFSTNDSPSVVMQWGMLNMGAGVMGLLGSTIILITLFASLITPNKCPNCGAKISGTKDLFCRTCGSSLKKS
jgi:hypothetical protein